jgi:putative transposase
MSIILEINSLIEFDVEDDQSRIMRVLYIDQASDALVWIVVYQSVKIKIPQDLPILTKYSQVLDHLNRHLGRKLLYDSFMAQPVNNMDLTDAQKEIFERNWKILQPIVSQSPAILIDRKLRGKLVLEAKKTHGSAKTTIYRLLRLYWIGGQSKYTLVPKLENSGANGTERISTQLSQKRGRPSRIAKYTKIPSSPNVTPEMKLILEKIGEDFYEGKRFSMLKSFDEGLKKYFKAGEQTLPDGSKKIILLPEHQQPTLMQFRYWYGKAIRKNIERVGIAREGEIEHNLKFRVLNSESTSMAMGPGSIFQVDATIPGVHLVSRKNRHHLIEKPVLYVIMDVFSRMIVGFWVGLEGPSWAGAIQAMMHMVEDKVEFCRKMGIEISPDEWSSHHLPDAMIADRGEFEGYNASLLVDSLGIKLSNTAPYRADWKGIIERHFKSVDTRIVNWLDGAVRLNRKGTKDQRLNATLTLDDFRKILTTHFLEYNLTNEIKEYPRDTDMMRDGVRPIPIELWNWGLKNRSGRLRTIDVDRLRIMLLPRDEASVTRQGIRFRGFFYTCDQIEAENWRTKAENQKMPRLTIAYDEWSSGHIYVRHPNTKEYMLCPEIRRPNWSHDVSWKEIELERELDRTARDETAPEKRVRKWEFQEIRDQTIQAARQETKATRSTESKRKRILSSRENRRAEKEVERESAIEQVIPKLKKPEKPTQKKAKDLFDGQLTTFLATLVPPEED